MKGRSTHANDHLNVAASDLRSPARSLARQPRLFFIATPHLFRPIQSRRFNPFAHVIQSFSRLQSLVVVNIDVYDLCGL